MENLHKCMNSLTKWSQNGLFSMLLSVKMQRFFFFNLWSFAGLLVLSSWLYSWMSTCLGSELRSILSSFFSNNFSVFSPLHCEILKSIIVKSRDSCWEHGLPVVKCSLKCFKIAIYPLNRNFLCSFLKWGFQGPCDICCACRDST